MNFLPTHAIEAIDRHDWTAHRKDRNPNVTRFYKYLLPAGNDMEIHTAAVKHRKDGTAVIKEVIRSSVDDPFMLLKDIAFARMGGYYVDWSPEKLGKPQSFDYRGGWDSVPYSPASGLWKLSRTVINPEALQLVPRFKYCSWTTACGDILDYLKTYVKHPRIELLAKAGAYRFTTRSGFIRQLENDKALMRFFMANLEEIRTCYYGVDVVRVAYKQGISLQEAAARIQIQRSFIGYGLPSVVGAVKAHEYISLKSRGRGLCDRTDYCNYLRDCQKLGLDLRDTKNAFPRHFKRQKTIIADQVAEIRRRQDAEQAKAVDAQIMAMAKRFARFEKVRGAFMIMFPRKAAELVREGRKLHNCLGAGNYAGRIARGESIIAFIRRARKPSEPFVTVEFSPKARKVIQCYADKNQKPPAPVLKFVKRVFNRNRKAA